MQRYIKNCVFYVPLQIINVNPYPMSSQLLQSAADLERRVLEVGFLPYFAGKIAGFSVEEMTDPSRLWDLDNGPWMWKGTVLRSMQCAYGKFSKRKAAYVSLDILPQLLAYRRYIYTHYNRGQQPEIELRILHELRSAESLLSSEIKELCGYKPLHAHRSTPLEKLVGDDGRSNAGSLKSAFDAIMTRLMMAGLVVIADFEYKYDRQGNRRGWGVARYTTPEALYGSDIVPAHIDPWQALDAVVSRVAKLDIPGATPRLITSMVDF